MSGHAATSRRRQAFTLIELLVVIAIIAVLLGLLIPAVQKARYTIQRTQSQNNLHQLATACHTFHDSNNYLPFNGTNVANAASVDSGSWAYQILPYIEQKNVYDTQTGTLPASWTTSISPFQDPMRSRAGYVNGSVASTANLIVNGAPTTVTPGSVVTIPVTPGSLTLKTSPGGSFSATWPPSGSLTVSATGSLSISGGSLSLSGSSSGGYTITITITTPGNLVITGVQTTAVSGGTVYGPCSGPITDYGINPFLNSPTGVTLTPGPSLSAAAVPAGGNVSAAHAKRGLIHIADGTSNTVLLGHMYCAISDYAFSTPANSNLLPIFMGGSLSTAQNGKGDTAATWLPDGTVGTTNQWGSPMREGGLMAMADGSVQLISYNVPLTGLLQPYDSSVTPNY